MKLWQIFKQTTLTTMFWLSVTSLSMAQTALTDIKNNVYKPEIEEAVELKIVSGFPDKTFRPNQPVTREEAVSMIIDAIATVIPVDLDAEPRRRVRPYLDVKSDRWSYKKLTWAQWNINPQGTLTGNFRPADYVTRAELIDFLRTAAELLKVETGKTSFLTANQKETDFTDVSGYNRQLTLQMSSYCGIASPLNEKGTKFAPNKPANRDYTAAAIVRTLDCIKQDPK